MQQKEYEKDLTILCERIGDASIYIKEMLAKQSDLNGYLSDVKTISKWNLEDKKSLLAMVTAMFTVDYNYQFHALEFSNISYGIFRNYEEEIASDIEKMKELEEKKEDRESEQESLHNEKRKLQRKQKRLKFWCLFCKVGIIFTILLLFLSGGYFAYLYFQEGLFSEKKVAFVGFVGCAWILLLLQSRVRGKKRLIRLGEREWQVDFLLDHEEIQEFREEVMFEERCLKYQVKGWYELQILFDAYKEEHKPMQKKALQLVQVGITESMKRKKLEHPEFFIHFPNSFDNDKELSKIQEYLEKRRAQLESSVYTYIMEQKKDLERVNTRMS